MLGWHRHDQYRCRSLEMILLRWLQTLPMSHTLQEAVVAQAVYSSHRCSMPSASVCDTVLWYEPRFRMKAPVRTCVHGCSSRCCSDVLRYCVILLALPFFSTYAQSWLPTP